MPNYDYDFRVLIDSINGEKKSYGTASFVSAEGTEPILSSSQVLDRINSLREIEYYNSKTYTTSSLDALFASKSLFTFSNTDDGSDYQFLSASIRGNPISGSILFTGNSTASGSGNDFIKRYKFYGNKVCNVLGIPENYWIYVDKFRFTNTGSEQNYLSGDVLGQSLHLTSNFAISNAGSIESDLPFQHARDTDRWLKWRNVSGSIPHNELQIGYSNKGNRYEIRTSDGENDLTGTGIYGTLPLMISASTLTLTGGAGNVGSITASGGFRVNGNSSIEGNGNLTITGQNTIFTANTVHNLKYDHSTVPMGITFNSFLGGKIQFKVPVDGTSTTLMELSGSDEGTATLKLTGKITASGDILGRDGIFSRDNVAKVEVIGLDGTGGIVGTDTNHDLLLRTNNTERLRIDTSGNISASNGIISNARNDKIRIVSENISLPQSVPTPALINVITSGSDTIENNALTNNASDPNDFHILLKREDNTNGGRGPGIAFASSTGDDNVGAAIIHERESSNSKGNLQFFVKNSGTGGGPSTKVMTLKSNPIGVEITGSFSGSADTDITIGGDLTIGGSFNPAGISTGKITGSSVLFGADNSINTFPSNHPTTPGEPILQLRRGTGGDNHINFFASDTGCFIISDDTGANQKNLVIAASPTGDNNTDRDIVFQTGKSSGNFLERMRIEGNGNVGIGTETPTEKLEVEGNISASGNYFGHLPAVFNFGGSDFGTNGNKFVSFLPGVTYPEDTDTEDQDTRIVMPRSGYIDRIVLRGQKVGNTTSIQVHKASNGTDADDADVNPFGSAVGREMNVADQGFVFAFGTGYSFDTGDILAFKIQIESDTDNLDGALVLMFNYIDN